MKMLLKWLKPQKPQLYDQPQPNVAIFITSFTFIQTGMILCFQRKLLFSATGLNLPMDQKNADFRRKEQHGMHEVSFSRSLDVPAVLHNFVISHTGFFIATAGSIVQDSKTRLQGDDIHSWSHDHLDLLDEGGEHRPHHLVGLLLGRLGLQLQVQQVSHPLHCDVVIVIIQGSKGILQYVGAVGEEDEA